MTNSRLFATSRCHSHGRITGPTTGRVGPVPANWEQPDSTRYGCLGPVPADWERTVLTHSRCSRARCVYGTRQRHSETHDWWKNAASGASVHSLPQGNVNVLPAVCAEHDSVTVKHVSSNGAIAKPTITTYMHTVSTGLGHNHESYPKQTADQDAVDAVTRQRDITRTAADTEVLFSCA